MASYFQPLGVLIEHRTDDVDESFVAGKEAVTTGEKIAFEPSLAEVLAENLHDAAVGGDMVVNGDNLGGRGTGGNVKERSEAVGGGLVGTENTEVAVIPIELHDVAKEGSGDSGAFSDSGTGRGYCDGRKPDVGHLQVFEVDAAVGVGVGGHAAVAHGGEGGDLGD